MTHSPKDRWTTAADRGGPLAGVKVVDLTTVVMGPFATQILGDMGADVVKVEAPGGDSVRGIGPWRNAGMGPLFMQNNRNKRSVVLDLKTDGGQIALHELVREADVLVSNIRPAAMERLGLTADAMLELNPQLIVCNAVGYGGGGRYSGRAVYDDLIQAGSGISGVFEQVDGAPRYAPVNIGDRIAALYIVAGILAALHERSTSGRGQEVEVPMFETVAQFVLADHMGGEAFVPALGAPGYPRLLSRTRGPYPTADGYLTLVVYTNAQWTRFLPQIGQEGLMERDPRFATQQSRTVHADEVGAFLAGHLTGRTTQEWLDLLQEIDIPASPVHDLDSLLTDPHLEEVGFFREYEHPTEGLLRTTAFPLAFSATPTGDPLPPPTLGMHSLEDVLPATASAY